MRDDKVDVLRFIGLAMIILAHVNPPSIIFQLRNFDVPLMVLVSGMSFGLSYKNNTPYVGYIFRRIKRLILPVWFFLTLYFSVNFIVNPTSSEINFRTIITSYTLISGIGYVWIIRVFLMVAIASPLIFSFNKIIHNDRNYFAILMVIFLAYEIVRYFLLPYIQDGIGKIIGLIIPYIIPYAIIFSIGLRMLNMNIIKLIILSGLSLMLFIFIGVWLLLLNGEFTPTQMFKYPPSIYYFSYALFVSATLFIFSQNLSDVFKKMKINKQISFVANNSMWIYLWHIPLIKMIHLNYAYKYIVVFLISILIVFLQLFILNKIIFPYIKNSRMKKNIKNLLMG
ncbi:acyltransferase [uncultured Tolumonas sp.]|uniref:acyltransferase family protein n=1 Tax=uncultured Tolumonas sp. TaxID=263765 RepID=UPI002A0A5AC6|nr:acyltransferase [uncultured Tolumonas sp.]